MLSKQSIYDDMKKHLKDGEKDALGVLRILISEIKKYEIETKKGKEENLDEKDIQRIVLKEIKKIKESIASYKDAGVPEKAIQEERELLILEKYAPRQMSKEELEGVIDKHIKETGSTSISDMGSVIKAVINEVGTEADGSMVSDMVKSKLST